MLLILSHKVKAAMDLLFFSLQLRIVFFLIEQVITSLSYPLAGRGIAIPRNGGSGCTKSFLSFNNAT